MPLSFISGTLWLLHWFENARMTQIEFVHVGRRGADTISSRWILDAPVQDPRSVWERRLRPGEAESPPRQVASDTSET